MRGVFGSLTTRGRSFVAAGGAAMVCGLAIPGPTWSASARCWSSCRWYPR